MAAIFDMPCFPFCFMYIVRVSSSTLTALSGGLNENSDGAGQVTDTRVFLPMDVTKPTIIADGYQRKVTSEHFTAAISAFGTVRSANSGRPYLLWFPVLPVYCRRLYTWTRVKEYNTAQEF